MFGKALLIHTHIEYHENKFGNDGTMKSMYKTIHKSGDIPQKDLKIIISASNHVFIQVE